MCVYLRKVFYPMKKKKESISFKVSCDIPFPLEGQTIGPPPHTFMVSNACSSMP